MRHDYSDDNVRHSPTKSGWGSFVIALAIMLLGCVSW